MNSASPHDQTAPGQDLARIVDHNGNKREPGIESQTKQPALEAAQPASQNSGGPGPATGLP